MLFPCLGRASDPVHTYSNEFEFSAMQSMLDLGGGENASSLIICQQTELSPGNAGETGIHAWWDVPHRSK